MSAAGAHLGESQTVTVTLPCIEDYTEDIARADRMVQAVELSGKLTPKAFERWIEQGEAIIKAQKNETAPDARAGEPIA